MIAQASDKAGRNEMFIVDAQVHIWGPDTPQRPWPGGRSQPHRPQPFSKDDLLKEMDAAGVARVVIVPPSWEGRSQRSGAGSGVPVSRPLCGDGSAAVSGSVAERLARSAGDARA